jgi:hypothetical protein
MYLENRLTNTDVIGKLTEFGEFYRNRNILLALADIENYDLAKMIKNPEYCKEYVEEMIDSSKN